MISIVIIDDEISTLNGISHILGRYPGEFTVLAQATSAIQALSDIKTRAEEVDVVITDVRMPLMDGVELVKILSEQYPHIKVVVLSGYSDYDYVRACLKHGAVDYLLKPCRYQTLLSLLRRICGDKLMQEHARKKESIQNQLRDMILSKTQDTSFELSFSAVNLCYMRPAPKTIGFESEVRQYIGQESRLSGIDDQSFLLIEIDDDILIIIDGAIPNEDVTLFQNEVFAHFVKSGQLAAMSYGKADDKEQLAAKAKDCVHMCRFAEFNAIARPVELNEQETLFKQIVPSGFQEYWSKERLLPLLYIDNRQALNKAFAKFCGGYVRPQGYLNPSEVRKAVTKLIFSIENSPSEQLSGVSNLTDTYSVYTQRITDSRNLDEIFDIIWDYILCVSSAFSETLRQPTYIAEAIAFIKSHYMEAILLSDISKKVYLNEWYFSSQFKKHIGVSFREYLNETRIEAAKKLLRDRDLKVGQIAEMVGFGDATYFATSFKVCTGKTPMEYRKSTGV